MIFFLLLLATIIEAAFWLLIAYFLVWLLSFVIGLDIFIPAVLVIWIIIMYLDFYFTLNKRGK